jgi:hypothetical protein
MSIRTTRKVVKFGNPFTIEGVGRVLPAGNYEVVTDEELIEGLSFPVYRRVATTVLAPTQTSHSIEMLTIDPRDLAAAVERDTLAQSRFSFGKAVITVHSAEGKAATDIIQANIDRFKLLPKSVRRSG